MRRCSASPTQRHHRRRWVGLSVALLAVLAVWWALDSEPATLAAPLGPAALNPRAFLVPENPVELPLPPPVTTTAQRFTANTVLDMCGLARLSVAQAAHLESREAPDADPDAEPTLDRLPAPVGRDALTAARERMLAVLRAGDVRARVTALLLSPPASDDAAQHAAWAQTLLHQAMLSQDVASLAAAEPACSHLPDAPACRLGLIRARLRIEPDNARHWAAWADEEPESQDVAWAGLLRAKRWQEGVPTLLLASQAALPPDIPGYLRLALGAEVRLRVGSPPTPGEGFVLEQCRSDLPQRRAECEALVQLMVERSDSPQTLAPAHRLAGVLGWPEARQQALHQELQDLLRSAGTSRDADQPWSCAAVESWQRHLAQVASVGELNALREQLHIQAPASHH